MKKYNPHNIEKKWQKFWQDKKLFQAKDPATIEKLKMKARPKKYFLVEFPYPSGEGLHVGHLRSYVALDVLSRKKRMEGFNVLYPFGWDAFGLPTENYAIKTGIHPTKVTEKNIKVFKKQIQSLGLSFDWSREINTTDPEYYKWTQWIFLKFFEKGLAYQAEMPINWCPSCKIGLANEEVVDGKCERCGAITTRKKIKQWMLKITKYADRLIEDLEQVDYLEKIKTQQINWIGRSFGTNIKFQIADQRGYQTRINADISVDQRGNQRESAFFEVFTTRVDTIFGVVALIVAPEHPIIENLKFKIENWDEIQKYIEEAKRKSDLERTDLTKTKTGVEIKGIKAINPLNNEEIPIWLADYVIASYGGGAVMMVPAHDARDFKFAKKYNLPIRQVVVPGPRQSVPPRRDESAFMKEAYTDYGKLINSGEFDGLTSEEAIEKITDWLEKKNLGLSAEQAGKKVTQYKLRDWIFSRQHYWGEPIPLVFCENCGVVAVPENKLPVKLPYVKKYEPTNTGESPLAKIDKWVKTKCPKCGGEAKRETDTMPNWAGSNWYYLAYLMKSNWKLGIRNWKLFKYWMPVDWYNGGMEHTTLHLLYSRFVYKFLYDLGVVPQPEPYQKRTAHGMVLAEDSRKMSKSFGNVINPDEIVKKYGADSLRLYEMFMGPFNQTIAWNTRGLIGCFRFLNRVWDLQKKIHPVIRQGAPSDDGADSKLTRLIHKTIKKVSEDIESLKFNTAVAALMTLVNEIERAPSLEIKNWELVIKILAPFAPHISEELWQHISVDPRQRRGSPDWAARFNPRKSAFLEKWPKPDEKYLIEEEIEFVVQINGKVRDTLTVKFNLAEEEIKKIAESSDKIKKYLAGKNIRKIIFIQNKLINFVVS